MAWLGNRFYFRELALICSIAIAPGDVLLYGQMSQPAPAAGTQQPQSINPQQLDSLVAPIALYPDPLLAQVLAASTYPLQIVEAHRWMRDNSNLQGKALVEAAGRQDWDPSIQALVAFPTVLQMLDQSLSWTTALGNAFLAQQPDVMAAVQRMRMKAQESGKLQSTPEQQVQTTTADGQPTIIIQPADPQVMYVPTYDPAMVYGAAPAYYPYPAVAYPTGDVLAAGFIGFGTGVLVGSLFNGCCGGGWGWGWGCNWGHHGSLYVNNNFFAHNGNTFVNRGNWGNRYAGNGRNTWDHNPRYRGSVPYANRDVANRFNGGRGGMRPSQLPANAGNIRPPSSAGGRAGLPGNMGGGSRPGQLPANIGAGNRPGGGRGAPSQLPANIGGNRPGTGGFGSTGSASRIAPGGGGKWGGWSGSQGMANRGGAFSGGSAGQARQFGNRGAGSMGGGGFRGGGGGFRGGGGSRGGGGGRRR
jgi:hypothetical protein